MKTCFLLLACVCFPTLADAGNWPQFRGPNFQNHADEKDLPLHWDESSVSWKTPIPGDSWSSPVVWEGTVYLTTATNEHKECRIIAVDAATGKIRWNVKVFEQEVLRKEGKNSYATPTACVDGRQVYAVFNDGGVAAVTLDGKIAWTNREVKFYSRHGLGSSPILHEGKLIMPYDGSQRVDAAGTWPDVPEEERLGWQLPWDKSKVVAFDCASGKRVWTAKRGMSRIAHLTPFVLSHEGRPIVVSAAGDVVQGFDPQDGTRLWSVANEGEGVAPSPAFGDQHIFAVSGYPGKDLRAISTKGKEPQIAWETKKGTPTLSSLLYISPHLYSVTDGGVVHCYDGKTGEVVYRERLEGTYSASPLYADGRIYFLSEDGLTTVAKPGPKFEKLASNKLDGKCQASIAVSDGRLFIRTDKHLYGIGK